MLQNTPTHSIQQQALLHSKHGREPDYITAYTTSQIDSKIRSTTRQKNCCESQARISRILFIQGGTSVQHKDVVGISCYRFDEYCLERSKLSQF